MKMLKFIPNQINTIEQKKMRKFRLTKNVNNQTTHILKIVIIHENRYKAEKTNINMSIHITVYQISCEQLSSLS